MGNIFELNKAKKLLNNINNIDGDNWPEYFTAQQISKLHFPNSDDSKILLNMLETAVNQGEIEFNDILVTTPTLPSDCSGWGIAIDETTNQPYRKEIPVTVSSAEWIEALKGFKINDGKDVPIKNKVVNLCLLERFENGLPKRWAYNWRLYGEEICYTATPLISRFSYAAWKDKPKFPKRSPLIYWLEETVTEQVFEESVTQAEAEAAEYKKNKDSVIEDNQAKPTCGSKGIHKLIDRAFYSISKPVDKITPQDVITVIKQERLDEKTLPKIDIDCIIKELKSNVISWQTDNMSKQTNLTYKHFSQLVRNLVKANAGIKKAE